MILRPVGEGVQDTHVLTMGEVCEDVYNGSSADGDLWDSAANNLGLNRRDSSEYSRVSTGSPPQQDYILVLIFA